MKNQADQLIRLLKNPEDASIIGGLRDWDLLVRQARAVGLLGRLYVLIRNAGWIEQVPECAERHLRWGYRVACRHRELVTLEVENIAISLQSQKTPLILLKGAAYCYAGFEKLEGRLFSDIDILVEKKELPEVEKCLEREGWLSTHLSPYDQHYYRQWMHEIPPLKHGLRQTELDVHHAILPETSRFPSPPSLLFENRILLSGDSHVYRLDDVDLILHSASHLFFDGEFKHGLRDLEDIRSLLNTFVDSSGQWEKLLARAKELGLSNPGYYALMFCKLWLGSEVPDTVLTEMRLAAGIGRIKNVWMKSLFQQALKPIHPSCEGRLNGFARYLLYVRSHYLRMPLRLLIPHLLIKAVLPFFDRVKKMGKQKQKNGILQLLEEKAQAAKELR